MKTYFVGFSLSLVLMSAPAYAYIDPGLGSMWIQSLFAIIAGLGVTLKVFWQRLKLYWYRLFKSDSKTSQKQTND